MKKITILLLLTSTFAFGQLKFVDMPDVKVIGASNGVTCEMIGEIYSFTFRDAKFSTINDYKSFDIPSKDFNEFFVLVSDGFERPPKKAIWIDLGNDYLIVSFKKYLGVKTVQFAVVKDKNESLISFSNTLTKKQIKSLFGVSKIYDDINKKKE